MKAGTELAFSFYLLFLEYQDMEWCCLYSGWSRLSTTSRQAQVCIPKGDSKSNQVSKEN